MGHSEQGQVSSLFAWKKSMTADAGGSAIDPNPRIVYPEQSFSHVLEGICKASEAETLFHLTKTQILISAHLQQSHENLTAVECLPEMLGQNSSPAILDCPHFWHITLVKKTLYSSFVTLVRNSVGCYWRAVILQTTCGEALFKVHLPWSLLLSINWIKDQ